MYETRPASVPETGMGPLISREHQNKVLSYYKIAAEEGATVAVDAGVPAPTDSDGRDEMIIDDSDEMKSTDDPPPPDE